MPQPNLPGFFIDTPDVAVAGTPVQFASHPILEGVTLVVRARPTNTGVVYVGTTSANATSPSTARRAGRACR